MEERETITSMLIERFENPPDWMEQAECADGEFDPFYGKEVELFIREKCNKCSVREQCREFFAEQSGELKGVFYGEDH